MTGGGAGTVPVTGQVSGSKSGSKSGPGGTGQESTSGTGSTMKGVDSGSKSVDSGSKSVDTGSKGVDAKMRPSELPIYGVPCEVCTPDPCSEEPGALECQIGVIRKELWVWHDKYQGLRKEILDTCQIGLAHTENTLEYLKEESNYLPRYGAIGLSGLAGVVLGLRGGAFKRLAYGSTGAGAMASLCYPREAGEVGKEVFSVVKRNVQIGYNFIYGIKPDYLRLPGPYPPDEGADIKKPRTKLFDTMKSQFLDLTAKLTPSPATAPAPVSGNDAPEKVEDDEWLADTVGQEK